MSINSWAMIDLYVGGAWWQTGGGGGGELTWEYHPDS